ncbi:MAG: DUF1015 domain-containing protein [Limnochordia bacterium]|jgi:uncharacterized protein (DUF1015 family)
MATIKPFHSVTYNPSQVEDVASVVTPPYDLINGEHRKKYYHSSPYNSIRLILGLEGEDDHQEQNRFARAARYWKHWLAQGVLQRAAQPAFYVYGQEFQLPWQGPCQRFGLVALLRLEEYDEKVVLPHEKTFPRPKAALTKLLGETHAHFSQIFCFYREGKDSIDDLLQKEARREPFLEVKDEEGVIHRIWPIINPGLIAFLTAYFQDKQIFIADGHHRYEAALAYRRARRQKAHYPVDQPFDYLPVTLFSDRSPGLHILPTHRLLAGSVAGERLLHQAASTFEIEPLNGERSPQSYLSLLANRPKSFICYHRGRGHLLRWRSQVCPPGLAKYPPVCRQLDVALLHGALLDDVAPRALGFTQNVATALQLVDQGEYEAAFLMNPTSVEEVMEVALGGNTMPAKSTFFFPKLLSGLVMYSW